MATIYTDPIVHERHVVHSDDGSSSAMMVVMVLLIGVAAVGFLLYATGVFPFRAAADTRPDVIEVNIPDFSPPVTNPPVNADQNTTNPNPVN